MHKLPYIFWTMCCLWQVPRTVYNHTQGYCRTSQSPLERTRTPSTLNKMQHHRIPRCTGWAVTWKRGNAMQNWSFQFLGRTRGAYATVVLCGAGHLGEGGIWNTLGALLQTVCGRIILPWIFPRTFPDIVVVWNLSRLPNGSEAKHAVYLPKYGPFDTFLTYALHHGTMDQTISLTSTMHVL